MGFSRPLCCREMKPIQTWTRDVLGFSLGQDTGYDQISCELPHSLQTITRYLKLGNDRFHLHYRWAKHDRISETRK